MLNELLAALISSGGGNLRVSIEKLDISIEREDGHGRMVMMSATSEVSPESPRLPAPARKAPQARKPRKAKADPTPAPKPAGDPQATPTAKQRIDAELAKHGRSGLPTADLAESTGVSVAYVSQIISKGLAAGDYQLVRRGTYRLASEATDGEDDDN